MNVSSKLPDLIETIRDMEIDASQGLPENLFLMISGLTPIPNVDLWIVNDQGQLLLSWRDDIYFGKGWHLPGGCIRYGETMLERVQKTALSELGTNVLAEPEPLVVRDVIVPERSANMPHRNERGHHITILFRCKVDETYVPDNTGKSENDAGYLKWFAQIPDNILEVHKIAYPDILEKFGKGNEKL